MSKNKQNQYFPLTLGVSKNKREGEGNVYGVYLRKQFHLNNDAYKNLKIRHAFGVPTKKAIATFGKDKLHVVILKWVGEATKSNVKGFKYMYQAEQSEIMPLEQFERMFGNVPTLNSGVIKSKTNF